MPKIILVICMATAITGSGFLFQKQDAGSPALAGNFIVDTLASNLVVPWEIVFLPDSSMVFTERNGRVRQYKNKQLIEKPLLVITGIDTTKKMGLLGLCLHPQFAVNKLVYLAYNYRHQNDPALKVVRYRFENDSLVEPQVIIDSIQASPNHTGCRLKFGPDKKLYITTGDADRPVNAQNLRSLNGKILRVNDDGSIPADNPFVRNDTARKEIWSYGHRNTQGIDFEPGTRLLFNSEHGPTGGDEVNIVYKGFNYGWPVIHHNDKKAGMQPPLLEYTPSVGPSQVVFYTGNAFPQMKGDLLLACLRGEKIFRFRVSGDHIVSQQVLFEHSYGRIRALTTGPDGFIYFSTSQNDPPEGTPRSGYDMILRLRPVPNAKWDAVSGNTPTVVKKAAPAGKTPALQYLQLCAGCHGDHLEGTERATSMMDGKWLYGGTKTAIVRSIRSGIIEKGMPAWEGSLSQKQIEAVAGYILLQSKGK